MKPKIIFYRREPNARLPKFANPEDIGMDVFSTEEVIIKPFSLEIQEECRDLENLVKPRNQAMISTGLVFEPEPGVQGYLRAAPRSGLDLKGIGVVAGVIDPHYRGIIKIIMINRNPYPVRVKVGDRIAQLIWESALPCEVVDGGDKECSVTERGAKGFGSSGTS